MHIKWNDQSRKWFENASEYTGYNKLLAEKLKKYIPCGGSLCDIGCGAGLFDYEMAEHCSSITCVDISPEAIAQVKDGAAARGIGNISALCADAATLDGTWDTVTALFFGGSQFFEKYFPLARERLIILTHAERKGKFGPEGHQVMKCSDIASTKEYLEGLGLKYTHEYAALEYGQPLSDMDEARAFVRAYSRPMSDETLEAYLAEKLEKTGNAKWPYYLPNLKEFGIFVIRRDENEKF